ncbi:fatty acid CoA ligase family protein [Spirillospora sp. CA-253888]
MAAELLDPVAMAEQWAHRRPDHIAFRLDVGRAPQAVSYAEMNALAERTTAELAKAGVGAATPTAVMVPPGRELLAVVLALLRLRAVPVLVDPGLPPRQLTACLNQAAPQAFIGIPAAHLARLVLGWGRASVRTTITVGPRRLWLGRASTRPGGVRSPSRPPTAEDPALLAFTSGSTGAPKGVPLRRRHLAGQADLLGRLGVLHPGSTMLSTFLPFTMACPTAGATAVVPRLKVRHPARTDPAVIVEAIGRHAVTTLFAPPALLDRVARHCLAHGICLDSVQSVLTAGAPLPFATLRRIRRCLPATARVHSVYGATEVLLVSVADDRLLTRTAADTARGAGTCLGTALSGNLVRVIGVTDDPITRWSDRLPVPPGTIGEITVAGPAVTDPYLHRPEDTALARIDDGGRAVHRMGDLGWQDDQGRVWFVGRKSERVRTTGGDLYTDQVEPIFNQIPGVVRTALVGIGLPLAQRPVLCVQPEPALSRTDRTALLDRIRAAAAQQSHTVGIEQVLWHPAFPMDVRHDSKIRRGPLARWAARQLHGGRR